MKRFFGHFDQKQKCSVFTFVKYIIVACTWWATLIVIGFFLLFFRQNGEHYTIIILKRNNKNVECLFHVVHGHCRQVVRLCVNVCAFRVYLLYLLRQETVKFTANEVSVSKSDDDPLFFGGYKMIF